MRSLLALIIAPFCGAALVTTLLTKPLPVAFACECVGDGFWVVEDVDVRGADAAWPTEGHLYPDRFSLWAANTKVELFYTP